MAFIESHQEIARHPKTKRLARELGVKLAEAIGYLHLLWWWAYDYAPEGDLSKYTAADVADGVGWDGDPEQLLQALKESEWVDRDTGEIHDWWEWAGKWLAKRKADSERKKAQRYGADIQRTSNGHPTDGAGTKPNLTKPNLTKPDKYTPDFDGFWSEYPKKTEKSRAFRCWSTRLKEGHTAEDMILAATHYAESCRIKGTSSNYIKHPSTFLGPDKPFLDYIKPPEEQTFTVG